MPQNEKFVDNFPFPLIFLNNIHRIELYGNHLEKLECAKVCLSLLVLLTFDYICPPLNLCSFAYLSSPLLLTDFITQRDLSVCFRNQKGEKLMVGQIIIYYLLWAHTKEEDGDTVSAMMTRSAVGWRSRSGQLWEQCQCCYTEKWINTSETIANTIEMPAWADSVLLGGPKLLMVKPV